MESVHTLKALVSKLLAGFRPMNSSGCILYSELDIISELELTFTDIISRMILMDAKAIGNKYGTGSFIYIVLVCHMYIHHRDNVWYVSSKKLHQAKKKSIQKVEEEKQRLVVSDLDIMIDCIVGIVKFKTSPMENARELAGVILEMFIRGLEANRNAVENVEIKRIDMNDCNKFVIKEGMLLEASWDSLYNQTNIKVVIYNEVLYIQDLSFDKILQYIDLNSTSLQLKSSDDHSDLTSFIQSHINLNIKLVLCQKGIHSYIKQAYSVISNSVSEYNLSRKTRFKANFSA